MEEKNKKRPFPPEKPKVPPKVRTSKPIKLKDRPRRNQIILKLEEIWGFVPEVMIIDKVRGVNNCITISVIVPEEVVKREADQAKKDREKANKLAGIKKKVEKGVPKKRGH